MSHTSRFSPVQDCDDSLATVHNWNRTPEMRAYIKELFMSAALCASVHPLPPPYHSTVSTIRIYIHTYIFTQCYSGVKLNPVINSWCIILTDQVIWNIALRHWTSVYPTFWRIVVPPSSGRNTPVTSQKTRIVTDTAVRTSALTWCIIFYVTVLVN
jgi:hypothetical protein